MRFYKIPISDLKEIDPDWEHRRTNIEGTEAIIHEEILLSILPQPLNNDMLNVPYPIYESNSKEFEQLLSSPEWTKEEERS